LGGFPSPGKTISIEAIELKGRDQMKSGLLFCLSLALLMAVVACSTVSSGNEEGAAAPEPAAPNSDQPAPDPQSSAGVPGETGGSELPAIEWPLTFKGAKVLQLDQQEGKPESGTIIEERLQTSTWEFLEDGTFTYDTERGVSTLYPVTGQYQLENNVLVFSGSRSHSYGSAGDSSVSIEGKIDLNASEPVASVLVKEKATAAMDDYGSTFSTNKNSTYSSELLLEPVR
jgi:hypothetical protein